MRIDNIVCTNCGSAYPSGKVPYVCITCGGLFDYNTGFCYDRERMDLSMPGIWRYRHSFSLPEELEPLSLGEGNTPLVWANAFGRSIAFKCEFMNPSGSFKDRGSTIIAAWLKWSGVTKAIEDSSGNAGASFAAYAARAAIKARIFVPDSSSGPKLRQIEAYGAELTPIHGSRSDVTRAVRNFAETGVAYASHAYLPFNLPGYATAAYEIFEQIGQLPEAVVVPAGQGGLLLGLARGFDALCTATHTGKRTKMIGVQGEACSPLTNIFNSNNDQGDTSPGLKTLAEGVQVLDPLRRDAVINAVRMSGGRMCITKEKDIIPGRDALAQLGFYVEPTSAIVWAALEKWISKLPDPVVVILTGSGLKYG